MSTCNNECLCDSSSNTWFLTGFLFIKKKLLWAGFLVTPVAVKGNSQWHTDVCWVIFFCLQVVFFISLHILHLLTVHAYSYFPAVISCCYHLDLSTQAYSSTPLQLANLIAFICLWFIHVIHPYHHSFSLQFHQCHYLFSSRHHHRRGTPTVVQGGHLTCRAKAPKTLWHSFNTTSSM